MNDHFELVESQENTVNPTMSNQDRPTTIYTPGTHFVSPFKIDKKLQGENVKRISKAFEIDTWIAQSPLKHAVRWT